MALVVDRLLPDDLDAGLRLSTQAGWNQVAADWRRALEVCPDGLLAGRLDGRVVATGCVASISKDIRWIGLILVDQELRGRGYGSIMMDHCLELAGRSGDAVVGLDASELGRPIYLKKGFVDVAPIDRWSGVLQGGGDPRDVDDVDLASFEQIAALDQEAIGTDRSALLKHLLQDPESVCLAAYGKGLEGFAFLLPGRITSHLGPVIARDGAILNDLLGGVARKLEGDPVIIDSIRTPENTYALERSGLTIARKLTRMTLGTSSPVLMGPRVRAAVSFTWG